MCKKAANVIFDWFAAVTIIRINLYFRKGKYEFFFNRIFLIFYFYFTVYVYFLRNCVNCIEDAHSFFENLHGPNAVIFHKSAFHAYSMVLSNKNYRKLYKIDYQILKWNTPSLLLFYFFKLMLIVHAIRVRFIPEWFYLNCLKTVTDCNSLIVAPPLVCTRLSTRQIFFFFFQADDR